MKIKDIIQRALLEVDAENGYENIEDISVLLPTSILRNCSITLESIWQPSQKDGWVYRVDSEDPRLYQQCHVHISKEKHKNSKNMQASWNSDGTRHDKKSFNDSVGKTKFVRQLAREVLNIPSSVCLEDISSREILITTDEVTFSQDNKEAYVRFLEKA